MSEHPAVSLDKNLSQNPPRPRPWRIWFVARRGERGVANATWASRNKAMGQNRPIPSGLHPKGASAALPRLPVRRVLYCAARLALYRDKAA